MFKIISAVIITFFVTMAIADVGTTTTMQPGEMFTWTLPVTAFVMLMSTWVLGYLSAEE
jgi:hypothetical protein